MRAEEILTEQALGIEQKRERRLGSRPERNHTPESRYNYKASEADIDEAGKASHALCTSSKPNSELGASQLNSCKAQGLRARSGAVKYTIGKDRVKVAGKKIKGKNYGGPLPKWS